LTLLAPGAQPPALILPSIVVEITIRLVLSAVKALKQFAILRFATVLVHLSVYRTLLNGFAANFAWDHASYIGFGSTKLTFLQLSALLAAYLALVF